jgi:hypothetical protein
MERLHQWPLAMQNTLRPALFGFAAVILAATNGCSGTGSSLPSLPELTGSVSEAPIVGSPTEVYERIARGALTCWFGTSGPLKADYVYHAEADPPGKGGNAEIIIHERDRTSTNPKGPRAYRVAITPEKESTTLLFENLKLPEARAMALEADARRWGAGAFGCAPTQTEGWSENAPAPPPLPQEGKKKHSSKSN